MYTDSIEQEQAFLYELYLRLHHSPTGDSGELLTDAPLRCPKCKRGMVKTYRESHSGTSFSIFQRCDRCGEDFDTGKIRSSIYFNTPYIMKDMLDTPFGRLMVTRNGQRIPFKYRTEVYTSNISDTSFPVHKIDIDLLAFCIGDRITCGFEEGHFEHDDSDECGVLQIQENDDFMIGLGGYNTEDFDYGTRETPYCYRLSNETKNGFEYIVLRNPANYDVSSFYESRIITLGTAWIEPFMYGCPEDELFLALL